MRPHFIVACLLACFVVGACNHAPSSAVEPKPSTRNGTRETSTQFIGTWIFGGFNNDITIMNKAEALDSNNYGFIFSSAGTFLERKNAGWCGTPPITYRNFSGEWSAITDSLLHITVGYWGGTEKFKLQIVSLRESELRVRYLRQP